ncbi:hypothetical protein IAD21_00900 [Abditibacteriota bacterium]|nr:hypothetical protein IAD21_00900 [Abditibacteriota bacterium]
MSHKSFLLGVLYAWATVAAVSSFAGKETTLRYLGRLRFDEVDAPLFTLVGIAAAGAHLYFKWRDG